MIARLAALAGTVLAQRATDALARVAGVRYDQRIEWTGGPWAEVQCEEPRYPWRGLSSVLHLDADPGYGSLPSSELARVVRLGLVVAAVQYAPDGGGTTRVYLAQNELTGAGADLLRAWYGARWQRLFEGTPVGETEDGEA